MKCPSIPGYEPVRFLGSSCLVGGTLHIARKLDEGVLVALQVFPRGCGGGPADVRFTKASQLLRWRHPNIFRVVDAGQIGPNCYVAMDFVQDSQSLTQRLERGPLRARLALSTALEMALVLEDARSKGLVWTRSSLSSIFLADDEGAKLCAWDFEGCGTELPQHWLFASLALFPPEWLTAESPELSPEADVYRIGVALYAMLAGRPPFVGEPTMQLIQQILESSPPPVRKIAPDVPAGVEALCMKCLAREPAERFPGPGGLMQAASSVLADLTT